MPSHNIKLEKYRAVSSDTEGGQYEFDWAKYASETEEKGKIENQSHWVGCRHAQDGAKGGVACWAIFQAEKYRGKIA